jgi:endonuclease YncB( thermonuclease family)
MLASVFFVILWFLCCSTVSNSFAETVKGKVVSVIEGDTIEVLYDRHARRIRLNGIDCPEKGQAFGAKAKQTTSELIFGKEVTLEMHGVDKYGRTIADVSLPDGVNINIELVRNGSCWWFQPDAPDNVILAELQRRARKSGIGLWADPHPIPPWEWRTRK